MMAELAIEAGLICLMSGLAMWLIIALVELPTTARIVSVLLILLYWFFWMYRLNLLYLQGVAV